MQIGNSLFDVEILYQMSCLELETQVQDTDTNCYTVCRNFFSAVRRHQSIDADVSTLTFINPPDHNINLSQSRKRSQLSLRP